MDTLFVVCLLAALAISAAKEYGPFNKAADGFNEFTWDDINAMDEYVHRDDGWFSWRIMDTIRYDNFNVTLHVVNMTSQRWMDPDFTTRSIWWHVMAVAIPDVIRYRDAGVFAVTGSSNHNAEFGGRLDVYNLIAMLFASGSGCVSGYMRQVPNQSMVFRDDPSGRSRSEDRIIAWTWREYIDHPTMNPEIVLRMPMTKSGKRGLDAMTEIAEFMRPGETDLKQFAVTGGSKRGWTAWSLGATDRRVTCIIPLVFSLLQIEQTGMRHFQALNGAWSWALRDYWDENITADTYHPRLLEGVFDYEDMIRYTPRFTMPKVMVAGTGDEFFSLTDSHPWWDRMIEPKYIMMIPNAQHTLAPWYIRIYQTALSVWYHVLEEEPLPKITWKRWETGLHPNRVGHVVAEFSPDYPPSAVRAWYGSTDNRTNGRRDFRMIVAENPPCGTGTDNGGCSTTPHIQVWRSEEVVQLNETHVEYTRQQEPEDNVFTGIFIEAEFDSPSGYPMRFTTEVQMVPDAYPGEACTEDPHCHTHLT